MLKNKTQKENKYIIKDNQLINYSEKEQNLINYSKNTKWIFAPIILVILLHVSLNIFSALKNYETNCLILCTLIKCLNKCDKDLILLFAGLLFSISASFIFGQINDYRNYNKILNNDYQIFKNKTEEIFLHNFEYISELSKIVMEFYCKYYNFKLYNEDSRIKLILEYKNKIVNYQDHNYIKIYGNTCKDCYFYKNNNEIHYFINKIDFYYMASFKINLSDLEEPDEILEEILRYYKNNIGIEIRTPYNSKMMYKDPWNYYIEDYSSYEDKIFYYYDKSHFTIYNEIQHEISKFYPYEKIPLILLMSEEKIHENNNINKQKYNPGIDELIPELKGKINQVNEIFYTERK